MIQTNKENRKECLKNDRIAFERVKETGEIAVYRCVHGLFEAVAPIYHYDIISGFLMMGQVCDNKEQHADQLVNSLKKVVKDKQTIEDVFLNIKEVPKELFDSYIMIMRVIAEYVTGTNRLFFGNANQAELIMKYMKQNYASKITLAVLSEKFSCSQSMLVKCFKKEYGTTIMNALMDIRLQKAAQRLKSDRRTLKEIANDCGFTEQNYFSKSFAKKYGCSPSEYRKK